MVENARRSIAMRETPENERPRERLDRVGPEALRDAELLAILFRTGTRAENAVQLAENVLAYFSGLRRLAQASLNELQQVKGVGRVKAIEIKAALELGKRLAQYQHKPITRISKVEDAVGLAASHIRLYETESFLCIHLNTKNDVLRVEEISRGGMDWVSIQPRDVFRQALREGAHGIILAHNHPSGDPEPSGADVNITRKLRDAAEMLGLRLLDHIIIGDGRHVSLKERGML